MRIARTLAILLFTASATSALAADSQDLSATELAGILGIKHWRVPVPADGFDWIIEIAVAVPLPKEPSKLSTLVPGSFGALISLRPLSDDEYEYTLNQGETSSSGSFVPCKEPEGSRSICDSYSISFEREPVCLPGCKAFVVGTIEAEGGSKIVRQIVISQFKQLRIEPGNGTLVIPIK